jgi:hypothetical protein
MRLRHSAIFLFVVFFFVFAIFSVRLFGISNANAQSTQARLILSPHEGTYVVGETFDVQIAIDTAGNSINAFKMRLSFPVDKLQVVSSGTGKSITGVWVRRPSFSNTKGYIDLEGAIPSPGINTDLGIITTITFRAKASGKTIVRFDHESELYLNDGLGTPLGAAYGNGIYELVLPAPQGPIVSSTTHPDQLNWYNRNDVVFNWSNNYSVGGYSYILNQTPVYLPDEISEGIHRQAVYKSLPDGTYYFHIRALRDGVWGGTTHYAVNIQVGAPAEYRVEVEPSTRTSSKHLIFKFDTTDRFSGIDRYEAKIIRIDRPSDTPDEWSGGEPLFFEVKSPFVYEVDDFGRYEFVVRAYNRAGNYAEASAKVNVVEPVLRFVSMGGVRIGNIEFPWVFVWPVLFVFLAVLIYFAYHIFRWHVRIELKRHDMSVRHHEHFGILKGLRERLGMNHLLLALLVPAIWLTMFATAVPSVDAAILPPPTTNILSKNINNDEIFYVGGRAATGTGGTVIVYLQSLATGETFSFDVEVQASGDWFYTHPKFISAGNYLIWTQLQIGEVLSPPSSQVQMIISSKAVQLGASRLSYETVYQILFALFMTITLALLGFIWYHYTHGHRKHKNLIREVKEARATIKEGFSALKKDIQVELEVLKQLKANRPLSPGEQQKERQLIKDLEDISDKIEKEVWDIEKSLGSQPI